LHFKLVNNGIEADLISGDLPQKKRIKLIQTIKEGKLKALVATDVASRGLHISSVSHVYNFDLPDEAANYVHRIGRTARAGARGFAYSLVCDDYGHNLAAINDLLGKGMGLHTEWPDDRYLTIVDKAGNPFEGRYRRDHSEPRGGGEFRGSGRGPQRPDSQDRYQGSGGGGGRGPRGGNKPQGRGPDRGPRNDRGNDRDNRGPQGGRGAQQGRGPSHQQGGQGGHQRDRHGGSQRGVGGGRQQHGHQVKGERIHAETSKAAMTNVDQSPKSFGDLIKKLLRVLFRWGK